MMLARTTPTASVEIAFSSRDAFPLAPAGERVEATGAEAAP
jgi:hypothetical protein